MMESLIPWQAWVFLVAFAAAVVALTWYLRKMDREREREAERRRLKESAQRAYEMNKEYRWNG
jgi:membrane protein implicated in regulation of membrane protease activity